MSVPLPPGADEADAPFWEACHRDELLVHRCEVCRRSYWPATCCVEHGWEPMRWTRASGRGEVHTYTIFHKAFLPDLADRVPYVVAVVQLDEGPFLHTDILGCAPDGVRVGMHVEVCFQVATGGWVLPHFRPVRSQEEEEG